MSNHPLNLALRFVLEIIALVIFFKWGWQHEGILKYMLSFGTTLAAMALWGVFRVPDDPGKATVRVHGLVRLAIEVIFFGFATAALFLMKDNKSGWLLLLIIIIHYSLSYDRVIKLVLNKPMR